MSKIELNDELLLGKGRERAAYLHPLDNSKVIKVVHAIDEKLNQNELEYDYLRYLERKKVPFSHLTKCYGFVNTNKGKGYVFDRVKDYNGKTSKSFKELVLNEGLSKENELELISQLKDYLFKNNILFIDIALSNVFCQEFKKGKHKLILTDGIGGKRIGLKAKLYQYSRLFTKYKVLKQWGKFIDKYNTVIKLGQSEKTRVGN